MRGALHSSLLYTFMAWCLQVKYNLIKCQRKHPALQATDHHLVTTSGLRKKGCKMGVVGIARQGDHMPVTRLFEVGFCYVHCMGKVMPDGVQGQISSSHTFCTNNLS